MTHFEPLTVVAVGPDFAPRAVQMSCSGSTRFAVGRLSMNLEIWNDQWWSILCPEWCLTLDPFSCDLSRKWGHALVWNLLDCRCHGRNPDVDATMLQGLEGLSDNFKDNKTKWLILATKLKSSLYKSFFAVGSFTSTVRQNHIAAANAMRKLGDSQRMARDLKGSKHNLRSA